MFTTDHKIVIAKNKKINTEFVFITFSPHFLPLLGVKLSYFLVGYKAEYEVLQFDSLFNFIDFLIYEMLRKNVLAYGNLKKTLVI